MRKMIEKVTFHGKQAYSYPLTQTNLAHIGDIYGRDIQFNWMHRINFQHYLQSALTRLSQNLV